MDDDLKKLKILFEALYISDNEENITKILFIIVKSFSPFLYKEKILNNPYFKSIFIDIVDIVLDNMSKIRIEINKEIYKINDQIVEASGETFNQLEKLKLECLYLLHELDKRKKEIEIIKKEIRC